MSALATKKLRVRVTGKLAAARWKLVKPEPASANSSSYRGIVEWLDSSAWASETRIGEGGER